MRNASRIAAGLGFWVATGVSGPALARCADKLEPDKNRYWVLNPVPDDRMRNFSTDRPTKSNVPCTVDAGHFQYETDIVSGGFPGAATSRAGSPGWSANRRR